MDVGLRVIIFVLSIGVFIIGIIFYIKALQCFNAILEIKNILKEFVKSKQ